MVKALIILILTVEIMIIYLVGSLLTATASPITNDSYGHDRHSTSGFTPASQLGCAIGQVQVCMLNAIAATSTPTPTRTPTPTPTPTHVPKTLSGVINNPIVNSGNSAISIKDRDQTISFSFETDVFDNRGSGAGWKLTESSTALRFGTNGPKSDLFLDAIKPIVVTCATNLVCSSTNSISVSPLGQDLVTEPITLATAPFAAGIGSFSIVTLGYFIVPASASIGQATGGVITITIFGAP
ncbi:MAG: hypothetical protein H0V70_16205 [Ktedonobacteraceae bacterium]|nr:hypothetical protein [Ktedonobacteraceae bacterium]